MVDETLLIISLIILIAMVSLIYYLRFHLEGFIDFTFMIVILEHLGFFYVFWYLGKIIGIDISKYFGGYGSSFVPFDPFFFVLALAVDFVILVGAIYFSLSYFN